MRRSAKLATCITLFATAAIAAGSDQIGTRPQPGASGTVFETVNLVSNKPGRAANFDPDLVNAWGLSQARHNPVWVSDNGSNKSTLYDPHTGTKIALTVKIRGGAPTGTAFIEPNHHGKTDFEVKHQKTRGSSLFVFASESGMITGWSPSVDPNVAFTAVDHSSQGSVYKGIAFNKHGRLLYAADFVNNTVEVFDGHFRQVGSFTDPGLPPHFAPFNVFVNNDKIYVAFAKREKNGIDNVDGRGLGYIDVFSADGVLLSHLVANGPLDAPWGMAIAPADFGQFAKSLLVGNFGDGLINAFNPDTGDFLGALTDSSGMPIKIRGLWGLLRNDGGNITFAAGPQDEKNGLIGVIKPVKTTVAQK
jgi:uncharacterized protein (TIGR03118 family)